MSTGSVTGDESKGEGKRSRVAGPKSRVFQGPAQEAIPHP